MKLKIKVFEITKGCMPEIIDCGEWIDLRLAETTHLMPPQAGTLKKKQEQLQTLSYRNVTAEVTYLPLGIAMELPKGFEAHILPRSSTPKKLGIVEANSQGIVDYDYNAETDEWKFPAIAIRETTIEKGTRICQFRIQLSQKATFWQKLKWLFSNGIELVQVDSLNNEARSGFGSTGVK